MEDKFLKEEKNTVSQRELKEYKCPCFSRIVVGYGWVGRGDQWRIQDFPGGGAPTPKVGVRTYFFGRKLHENERILESGGGEGRPWRPP